jgi:hypothetical protein
MTIENNFYNIIQTNTTNSFVEYQNKSKSKSKSKSKAKAQLRKQPLLCIMAMRLFRIGLSHSKHGLIISSACNNRIMISRSLNLANPMFVHHKKIPDLPEEPLPPPDSKDFLSQHGGKVALAGFSFAGALIYRWLQGSKNKRDIEHSISRESPLHPYESNDLREKNSMTVAQYQQFVNECISHCSSGVISYKEFLSLFHKTTDYQIVDGYILDRLVLFYIEKHMNITATIEDDAKIPVVFLLVLLSNIVASSPNERAEMLFDVCRRLPSPGGDQDYDGSTREDFEGEDLYCSVSQAEIVVEQLDRSWQVSNWSCLQLLVNYSYCMLFPSLTYTLTAVVTVTADSLREARPGDWSGLPHQNF